MSISTVDARAAKVWFDEDHLWVLLQDGRKIATPLSYFPRLLKADPGQRAKVELSGGGLGLHWDDLDEDISVPGLLAGRGDATRTARPMRLLLRSFKHIKICIDARPLPGYTLPMIPTKLGADLASARRARGWTQARLAEEAGLSQQHVSLIERDPERAELRTLSKLYAALGQVLAPRPAAAAASVVAESGASYGAGSPAAPGAVKRRLEALLRRHGYRQDERPDHREWWKSFPTFQVKVWLDQNDPEGFRGVRIQVISYLRWGLPAEDLEAILARLKEDFGW